MNLNAAALRLMAAKGLTLDDVAEIVAANENTRDTTATERKRRQRARDKGECHAVTVTRDGSPIEDIHTPPVSPLVNSNELTSPGLTVDQVVEAWNHHAEAWGLRRIVKLTAQRRRKIGARIRQFTVDEFTEAIAAIGRSSFLRGENDRGWRADFDWMLNPTNFTKLIEGTYER